MLKLKYDDIFNFIEPMILHLSGLIYFSSTQTNNISIFIVNFDICKSLISIWQFSKAIPQVKLVRIGE